MRLERLSMWLWPIQRALGALGYGQTIVGGSAARAVLDACARRRAFDARDVDLFVVAHGAAVRAELAAVLAAIGGATGARTLDPLRIKERASASGHARVIGYGAHMQGGALGGPILSVTVLHDEELLGLNGVLDVDTVRLRLDNARPLMARLSGWCDFAASPRAGVGAAVVDPLGGYAAWSRGQARVVGWGELTRRPLGNTLRLMRSAEKLGVLGASPWRDGLRERAPWAEAAGASVASRELGRDVHKMLGRARWRAHLEEASRLGVFAELAPGLDAWGRGAPLGAALGCEVTRGLVLGRAA
jgi:hypothetical protein